MSDMNIPQAISGFANKGTGATKNDLTKLATNLDKADGYDGVIQEKTGRALIDNMMGNPGLMTALKAATGNQSLTIVAGLNTISKEAEKSWKALNPEPTPVITEPLTAAAKPKEAEPGWGEKARLLGDQINNAVAPALRNVLGLAVTHVKTEGLTGQAARDVQEHNRQTAQRSYGE